MAESSGCQEWNETAPDGTRFRVVVAPRGDLLRGSASSDFFSAAAEILVGLGADNGTYKVGVFKQRTGMVRLVHKSKEPDKATALAEAERIRLLLRAGRVSELAD